MKSIIRYGAAILALALFMTACSKKSSNSSASLGTTTFSVSGQSNTMVLTADTTYLLTLAGAGLFSSTSDSAALGILLYKPNVNIGYGAVSGLWSDTATVQTASIEITAKNGKDYTDANPTSGMPSPVHPFIVQITSNNGTVLTGTYSGELYNNTNAADSLLVTNGSFSVKLQ
ncbi:hypothetical protein [Dinghuibacter silviterrae]|uniref:Uncharacterized protein n=1 Tax=Dinghuibacter silviterrae TaxID=1539049 RepID=A0A4R8DRV9_9BACT|nr:hypothetical protein [Dinghuibacter silviterrae]TDX00964.1 hypothetical protein EDB95_1995 [Dinghuibacter silviterrae]